jgi:hypothetical protein
MLAIAALSACAAHAPPPRPPPPRLDVPARSAVLTALAAEDRGDSPAADEAWTRALRIAPRDPGLHASHYASVAARDPAAAAEDLVSLATLPLSDPETCWSVARVVPPADGARWLAVAVEGRLDPAIALAAARALPDDRAGAERLWADWRPATPEGSFERGRLGLALGHPAADDLVAGSLGIPRTDGEIGAVVAAVSAECRLDAARAAAARYPWTRLARALTAAPPCRRTP